MTNIKYQNPNRPIRSKNLGSGIDLALKYSFVICVLSFVICSCGCAKVVTPVFKAGKTITIMIDYKGNIDPIQNKYYILFNNDSAPNIPFMPIQFVEPGDIPSQPDVDYYGQYYSTWKSFIVLDGNAFYFVRGPYTSEAVPTREVFATWSGAQTKQIMLSFNISKLGTLTNRLNFDFVSVDKATKLVEDNLSSLTSSLSPYYIFTISNSTVSGSDEVVPGIRDSLNILDWRVLIQ